MIITDITVKGVVDSTVHVRKTIRPNILFKDLKPGLKKKTKITPMVRRWTISIGMKGSKFNAL